MKLLYDRDIKLLLRDQNFNVSAPERWRHSHVEQSLREPATPDGKAFYSAFTSPVTGLDAGRHAHLGARPDNGAKNQPLPGGLLQTSFGFLDSGIFFQRHLENTFQSEGASAMHDRQVQSATE